jgi:hypothetical protein
MKNKLKKEIESMLEDYVEDGAKRRTLTEGLLCIFSEYKQELKKKVEGMKYKHMKYGYRRKGEIGTATNGEVCKSHNYALNEVIKLLEE